MKSKIIWIIVAVVVVGGYFALNKEQKPVSTEPIKIGTTLPLTGNLAFVGQSDLNGLILASEEINNTGGINGRSLSIVFEDNQGDAKIAVSTTQKLLELDKVQVIFSAFTHTTKAISSVIKAKGIPLVYSSTDGTVATESDLFFRDYFDAEQGATTLFKKARADGKKKFKVISEQQDGCLLFVDTFKKEALTADIQILDETYYQATENDFRSHLTKLNLKSDESLLVCAFRHAHLLMKNMSDLGLLENQTYHFVGPFLPISNDLQFRELYSKNKAVSTWYGFAETGNTKKQEEYIKRYKERFGQDPVADSAYFYDEMYILSAALRKCMGEESIDKECFKKVMIETDYTGVAGRVIFDSEGRSYRDTILIQAENNQWKTVK